MALFAKSVLSECQFKTSEKGLERGKLPRLLRNRYRYPISLLIFALFWACPTAYSVDVDLAVSMAESVDPVVAGSGAGNLTYTATVTNNGPSNASGVALSEALTLPVGVTIVSITPSGATTYAPPNANNGTWTVGALASGASETLTIVLTVANSAASGANAIDSTASVTAVIENDTNALNNSGTAATTISRQVDLAVSKIESADPVTAGSGANNLTHTVTVTNNGPSDASGITLSEDITIPAGVTVDSVTPSVGSFANTVAPDGTWTLGNLASGSSATLTVVYTAGASAADGTTVSDTATVTAFNETDTNTLNNSASEATTVNRQVDLAVSKVESSDPVVAGSGAGNLTYTATVTNNGPSDASGVALSEALTLPAGVSIVSITPSGVTTYAPPNTNNGTWTVGALASGASETLTIVLTVASSTAAGANAIDSTATVTAVTETDTNALNNSAAAETSVTRNVDLAVSMTESIDPVVAGSGAGNLTHTVTVTNNGPSDASGITLSEDITIPAGITVDSVTPSVGSFANTVAPDGTWTLGNLASGASATLTVIYTASSGAADGSTVSDTATASAVNEIDTNALNDSATEVTTISRQVDLAVSMAESIDPVVAGSGAGNLTYTATVTNNGPSDASGVTLSETLTLPAGVTIVSITPSGATTYAPPNTNNGTWTVGALASGASETLTVVLTIASNAAAGANVIDSTATVTTVIENDTNALNNSAAAATSVTRNVDLAVSMAESIDPVVAGSGAGNLTYTATVTNNGPSNASGVTLSEALTLPAGVTIVSITPSGTTTYVPPNTNNGTWTVGALASGASETLTVVLTVASNAAAGTNAIDSTATVTAVTETDTNALNNLTTEATTIAREANLAIVKVDDGVAAAPGKITVYTLTITNNGPSDASGVTVSEAIPDNTTFDVAGSDPTWIVTGTGVAGDPCTFSLGDISVGGNSQVDFAVLVDDPLSSPATSVNNVATVTSNELDPDSADNSATIDTPLLTNPINDIDGDGLVNDVDLDDDGDGKLDPFDPDRDGDGVNNDLDPAPDDPSVVGPLGTLGSPGLSIRSLRITLHFDEAGHDKIIARGVFPLPPAFEVSGKVVDVDVGGETQSFTLDEKGLSKTSDNLFRLRTTKVHAPNGTFVGRWKLAMKRGSFVVSDVNAVLLANSNPGEEDRVLKMTLSISGGQPDLRYNVGTVVYRSTDIKGTAKNKRR